jgi:hypothetical protein
VREIPGALERALTRASRAARRELSIFGMPLSFGEGSSIDWSVDPVSRHRFQLAPSHLLSPPVSGADVRYPWLVGRLDQLVALGQGYWASADPAERARFAREFVCQTEEFIRENPVGLGVQWASPMEVALRAANVALALWMFSDSACASEPSFLLLVLQSIVDHAEFVEAHLEDAGAVPNNHLIANHVGLLVVGLAFPQLPGARRWAKGSAQSLSALIEMQVHPDGYFFEGSTSYHRLAVELFVLAHLSARAAGVDLGAAFRNRLRKMFQVAAAYCSEQGRAPQIGDNDSGRIFPLRDRQSLDHGYLAPLGAALFGDAALKVAGGEFPDEAAWLLGSAGWEAFRSLPLSAPPPIFTSPAGGLHILRGGGAVAAVSAGPVGQNGIGGHSHNDQLSFELHLDGRPIIVDIGSPTYLRDPQLRNFFRSTAAHNTVQLGGEEQAPLDASRPFALLSRIPAAVERLDSDDRHLRLIARSGREPDGIVRRTFVLQKLERALSVKDEVVSRTGRRAVGRLHLPDSRARLRALSPSEQARAEGACEGATHFGERAAEIGAPEAPLAVIAFGANLDIRIETSHYSPGYGQVQPAAMLVYSSEVEQKTVLAFVALFGSAADNLEPGAPVPARTVKGC